MDDEFKLCWKNFQDNIASGFQSLYDRGDLVDVTLACDGKLLQAHKIVLAICSPYFQEIFITNPCKHPIIILKDVSYAIMCELLEFMYQGVVNVKHTELQAFMKIGQLLQIKGLATNSSTSTSSSSNDKININNNTSAEAETATQPPNSTPKTPPPNDGDNNSDRSKQTEKPPTVQTNSNSNTPQRSQSPVPSPVSPSLNISNVTAKSNDSQPYHLGGGSASGSVSSHKRQMVDFNSDALSIYSRNKIRRSLAPTDHNSENNDGSEMGGNGSMDQMNAEDFFLPHITMSEPRYELSTVKRDERSEHHSHPTGSSAAAAAAAAASLRNSFNPSAFGLDYTFYKNGGPPSTSGTTEYPNDLNPSGDFGKGFANHMDIPPNCPNVVMLNSTSLLHGNCVFNRNNTVATQQGMKTYWLCKSYRISMCRARCITHQGKIISATGVHNHAPHMRGNNAGAGVSNMGGTSDVVMGPASNSGNSNNTNCPPPPLPQQTASSVGLSFTQNISTPGGNMFPSSFHAPHHGHPMTPMTPPSMQHPHPISADAPSTMNSSSTSHHFGGSISNLVQHHGPHQQLLPPTTVSNLPRHHSTFNSNGIQTIMHGSTINTNQQVHTAGGYSAPAPPSGMDHNRISSQPAGNYGPGPSDKTDDHIPVHNAAELSPAHVEDGHQHHLNNSTSESPTPRHQHQPVQVIDSITISPGGNGHNFKMEPL